MGLISNHTIEEASDIVTRQITDGFNKPSSQVELLGLKVNQKMMYVLAPITSVVLILYLITLVSHLNFICSSVELLQEASKFPWMALFPDLISRTLTTVSVLFYPLLTAILVVNLSDMADPDKWEWFFWYLGIFCILEIYLVVLIVRFRKKIKRSFN